MSGKTNEVRLERFDKRTIEIIDGSLWMAFSLLFNINY